MTETDIATPRRRINLDNLGIHAIPSTELLDITLNEDLPYSRYVEFVSATPFHEMEHFFSKIHVSGTTYVYAYGQIGDVHYSLTKRHSDYDFNLAGNSAYEIQAVVDKFAECLPPVPVEDEFVTYSFWALDGQGNPTRMQRKLAGNKWPVIQTNYPKQAREKITSLINMEPPDGGGKLMLWHGPPGTGKTHCVRALADSWKHWCNIEYVVDPEELFRRSYYLMRTLVGDSDAGNMWRLIILEDSGEFLREKAADQIGHGFARLLNITDGIIGQGLKLIILITTNERLGELHPAVTRPGRCLANIEFDAFPATEAQRWLDDTSVARPMTLAAMYEQQLENQIVSKKETYRPGAYV